MQDDLTSEELKERWQSLKSGSEKIFNLWDKYEGYINAAGLILLAATIITKRYLYSFMIFLFIISEWQYFYKLLLSRSHVKAQQP